MSFHKFEAIKYMQELNEMQKKIEEDLKTFTDDKKTLQEENEKLYSERFHYRKGIYLQIDGFGHLVKDLKESMKVFEQAKKEGSIQEVKREWQKRKDDISSFLQDLKQDLVEREEFLLSEDVEVPFFKEDAWDYEYDSFLENLPNNLPM